MPLLKNAAKAVGCVVALLLAGYGGSLLAPPEPAPPPPVVAAPQPAPEATPAPVALAQIPIPTPPVVTGLPYPAECHAQGKLPDPSCTPGSVNPKITQANIASTICKSGWTATVRPPASNTNPVKSAAMKAYGVPSGERSSVELDHLVPLESGGSDDVTNLWPEPSDISGAGFRNTKDVVENDLKKATCAGKITLADAQKAIAQNWTTAEAKLGIQ